MKTSKLTAVLAVFASVAVAQSGDDWPDGAYGTEAGCNSRSGPTNTSGSWALVEDGMIQTAEVTCVVSWNREVEENRSFVANATCHLPNDPVPEATLYAERFDIALTAQGAQMIVEARDNPFQIILPACAS